MCGKAGTAHPGSTAAQRRVLEQTLVACGRYLNGRVYADYKWRDETSQFDPKGRWNGHDSYNREYRCRVPRRMLERALIIGYHGALMMWIERNSDNPIWLD